MISIAAGSAAVGGPAGAGSDVDVLVETAVASGNVLAVAAMVDDVVAGPAAAPVPSEPNSALPVEITPATSNTSTATAPTRRTM
jgi:hypothetical protein